MYSNHINKSLFRLITLFSLAMAFVLISDTTAQAQNRRVKFDRYEKNNRGNYETDGIRAARQYGYEDGFEDGADAGRERDVYHPENSGDWQKGTNGYEGRFGNKKLYKQAYRAAYKKGYKAGYERYLGKRRIYRRN